MDAPVPPRWLREVPLAHRGLHGADAAENTLAAFAAARAAGVGVELDVRLSADGVPVIAHDASLQRIAGVGGTVGRRTAAQLAALRVGGTDQGVPTLAEALAMLGDAPVMVEVKSLRPRAGAIETATAAVLDGHRGPWCLASFNPATLRWFRRHRPGTVRVLTATDPGGSRLPARASRRLAALPDLVDVAPAAVSYRLAGLPAPAVTAWRASGGLVVAWTARTAEDLAHAARHADNVIFEDVAPPR